MTEPTDPRALVAHLRQRHADEMAARDSYTRTIAVLALAIGLAIGAVGGVIMADEIMPMCGDAGVARGR